MRIEKRYQDLIRTDSTATFISEGLLGDQFVNIRRGFSGRPIQAGEEIRVPAIKVIEPADFLEVLGKLASCMKEESREAIKSKTEAGTPTIRK